MGILSKFFGSIGKKKNLNSIAEDKIIKNQARAVMIGRQRGLNEDERLALFMDAGFHVINELMDEYNASFDEAFDAYMNTSSGRSKDGVWLRNILSESRDVNGRIITSF